MTGNMLHSCTLNISAPAIQIPAGENPNISVNHCEKCSDHGAGHGEKYFACSAAIGAEHAASAYRNCWRRQAGQKGRSSFSRAVLAEIREIGHSGGRSQAKSQLLLSAAMTSLLLRRVGGAARQVAASVRRRCGIGAGVEGRPDRRAGSKSARPDDSGLVRQAAVRDWRGGGRPTRDATLSREREPDRNEYVRRWRLALARGGRAIPTRSALAQRAREPGTRCECAWRRCRNWREGEGESQDTALAQRAVSRVSTRMCGRPRCGNWRGDEGRTDVQESSATPKHQARRVIFPKPTPVPRPPSSSHTPPS